MAERIKLSRSALPRPFRYIRRTVLPMRVREAKSTSTSTSSVNFSALSTFDQTLTVNCPSLDMGAQFFRLKNLKSAFTHLSLTSLMYSGMDVKSALISCKVKYVSSRLSVTASSNIACRFAGLSLTQLRVLLLLLENDLTGRFDASCSFSFVSETALSLYALRSSEDFEWDNLSSCWAKSFVGDLSAFGRD